uniref:MatE protein n=1 Tax=Candidatus Kentrum eta TaxID=2126337 RepID=A0A450UDZ3_9GAMM|nr:MAG: MatE protein [Candidatus Kentron sp. H]VFJ90746.1 MAG: MatE protein [Candidatus Kentron sp. H]VFJ96883.1 MAG: MatE protein [Candidatus Kentron sp. H]
MSVATRKSGPGPGRAPSRDNPKSGFFSLAEFSATFGIALPLALGYLGQRATGITDTIMLGRLGPEALSASGLALSVYNLILFVGFGMLFPIIVLAAHARGANRSRTVPRLIRQGLWIRGILAVTGGVI